MNFQIRASYYRTGRVLFSLETATLKACVEAATGAHASLAGAYLRRAELPGANLRHAALRGANLSHANLFNANLSFADLRDANLRHAYMQGTNLYGAILRGARLPPDIASARTRGAGLAGAHLPKPPRPLTPLPAPRTPRPLTYAPSWLDALKPGDEVLRRTGRRGRNLAFHRVERVAPESVHLTFGYVYWKTGPRRGRRCGGSRTDVITPPQL